MIRSRTLLLLAVWPVAYAMAQEAAPETVTTLHLANGAAKGQRVRLTGVVHDVAGLGGEVQLLIQGHGAGLTVRWSQRAADNRPDDLLDALVEVTGVALPAHSQNGRTSPASVRLATRDALRVLKPGGTDAFSRPLRTLGSLREPPTPYPERFRVLGTVTYASNAAGWFYLQDETGWARAGSNAVLPIPSANRRPGPTQPPLQPGDTIEVVGYVWADRTPDALPWLAQCEWRVLHHGPPPAYAPAQPPAILQGDYDGKPVSVKGLVVHTQVDQNFEGHYNHTISLEDDGVYYTALLQKPKPLPFPIKIGDYVQMVGVATVWRKRDGRPERFRVNINDFQDIERLNAPWRVKLAQAVPIGLAVLLGAVVWIVALRLQVRKQVAQLRSANEELGRFKAVADSTSDLVAMSTLRGRALYINPAGRQLLGIPLHQKIADLSLQHIYPPDVLEMFAHEDLPQGMKRGHWAAEIRLRHNAGHDVPVSFVGLIIKSPEGVPLYMSCIARDISERHQLEKQLRDALEQERELGQMKGSFVNTISHEFRTPLGIILFASSMLRRFDARFGPAERAQQLDAIDEAVQRMNDLVEQSLSLGRAEVAKPDLREIDPLAICRRVVDEIQSATSHRCHIWLAADGEHAGGRTDETMLRTILVNLLGNAVKYSPEGSQVTLNLCRNDSLAVFTVRDHGPGLSEEDIPKLFETFHRGRHTASTPGTGLGLAIVKRCVETLGGSVCGANATGGGAEFTVHLPMFQEHMTTPSQHHPST
ncbi:MAG: PAS domain-containing sensor histidine kinase [Roseimicrobium sp.]